MNVILPLAAIGALLYLVFFVFFPLGRGAIYDPSSPDKARLMIEVAGVSPADRAADLGSGDGRIVIAVARAGAECHGYEVNPFLVLLSRRNIRRAGLEKQAFIHWGSFWGADLSSFSLITVFQVDFVMGRLENKIKRELPPGARVVSHHWRFPKLTPSDYRRDIYLYRLD